MHNLPEKVAQLKEEGKDYHEEWRMVHFHCLLLSDAFEDGDAKKRGEEEEQSQMQSKSTLLFIGEMVDCISIACLCDNIEVHLNFGHDLICHVGLLVTVHYHEVVNAR